MLKKINEVIDSILTSEVIKKLSEPLNELRECRICPRNCGANRLNGKSGYCKSDSSFYISSICIHHGEEPPISGPFGICNVFFGHCNLQCIFCQNHQISNNKNPYAAERRTLKEVVSEIVRCLDAGCKGVGFVSPSHFVPQMKIIIKALHKLGRKPVIVYNTNGYDKVETLQGLEEFVDVYLPDLKYIDPVISARFSDAGNYPEIAGKALKEMYRQKGSTLITDKNGIAERGILIRHLVLPGYVANSKDVLKFIANEFSTSMFISLMSQYHPTQNVMNVKNLNRTLYKKEYREVVDEFYRLGLRNGWIQDLESHENYKPDFRKKNPFE